MSVALQLMYGLGFNPRPVTPGPIFRTALSLASGFLFILKENTSFQGVLLQAKEH